MSRLTGNDAKNLMEAYAAVYTPQKEVKLTEEQIWEEVENWVNTLLEEGYDLSEYTWEEMYESYIEEVWGTKPGQYKSNKLDTAVGNVARSIGNLGKSAPRPAGSRYAGPGVGWVGPGKPSATPKPAPPAPAARPAATSPSRPVAPTPRPAPRPAARPAAPAPRPAARPAAPTSKQTGDKAKDTATWAKANPALASRVTPSGTQAGTGQSQMAKQAAELRAMRERSQQRQGVKTEEYDAYDLVLEYLLSQGHADTVEEANYVMLEMDAEMIYDIVSNYKN